MAHALTPGEAVSLQEMLLAQIFESEALLNVLEREGLLTKPEVLEEVKRLRAKGAKAQ